jgi:RNA polymerase sigma factor (sigma-70 family)
VPAAPIDVVIFEPATADVAEGVQVRDAVRAALMQLPVRQRTAVVLRYFEQWNTAEIGAATAISESSVRSAISRGVEQLRENLRFIDNERVKS